MNSYSALHSVTQEVLTAQRRQCAWQGGFGESKTGMLTGLQGAGRTDIKGSIRIDEVRACSVQLRAKRNDEEEGLEVS